MKLYLRNKFKKLMFTLLIILLLSNIFPSYGDDTDDNNDYLDSDEYESSIQETSAELSENSLNLNSRNCVVLDRVSKQKLFGKSEDKKVKMASTTKIMTAIVVIENYDLNAQADIS